MYHNYGTLAVTMGMAHPDFMNESFQVDQTP